MVKHIIICVNGLSIYKFKTVRNFKKKSNVHSYVKTNRRMSYNFMHNYLICLIICLMLMFYL